MDLEELLSRLSQRFQVRYPRCPGCQSMLDLMDESVEIRVRETGAWPPVIEACCPRCGRWSSLDLVPVEEGTEVC